MAHPWSGCGAPRSGEEARSVGRLAPCGKRPVSSYLAVQGAERLVEFLCSAFGAVRRYQSPKGTHFEVSIGDSIVMIGEVGKEQSPTTGQLFMYVPDPDKLYKTAVAVIVDIVRTRGLR